jgi:hypothetical protein
MKTLFKILTLVTFMTASSWAGVPAAQRTIAPEDVPAAASVDHTLNVQDVARVIPTNMGATNDGKQVEKQVLDHSMQSLMKSKVITNNQIAKAAQSLQENFNPSMSFGGTEPNDVQHKINFKVMAFQKQAQLHYTGYLNAVATYSASDNNLNVTVSEDLTRTTHLQLVHESVTDQSSFNLKFDW